MNQAITCALCGTTFTESGPSACQQCPLHGGCELACCPNCGYSNLADPQTTKSGRWLARLFRKEAVPPTAACNLAESCADCVVRVTSLEDQLPDAKLAALLACGIQPGCVLRVIQQRPVTVVQVDEMEIALEDEIARLIQVE